jgi:hypothetical protein
MGDYIIVRKSDGKCDVEKVFDDNERRPFSVNRTFNEAVDMAWGGCADGDGRVWGTPRFGSHIRR